MEFATRIRPAFKRSGAQLLIPIAVGLLLAFSASAAPAINLVMSFDSAASDKPTFDPDGSLLKTMMRAVESYWEDILEAPGTLNVKFYYDDLEGEDTLAEHLSLGTIGTKPSACQIRVDTMNGENERLWYFDPTPTNNSEYAMKQVRVGDLKDMGIDKSDWFNGTPNDLLETGFGGLAKDSAPAAAKDGYDLFSVLLHETAHGLGMNGAVAAGETVDRDYDLDRDLLWGRSVAAKCAANDDLYHLKALSLMHPGTGPGLRVLPSALDVLAVQTSCNWSDTSIDLVRKDFYSTQNIADWNTTRNWEGNRTPDSGDNASICHGHKVSLSADASAGSLLIDGTSTGKSELLVGNHHLTVRHSTNVGRGARLADISVIGEGGKLTTNSLVVNHNSSINLAEGGQIDAGALTVKPGATLGIELGEFALDTGFDFLNVTGLASLGGTLDVSLQDGFTLDVGDEFLVMTFGSSTGNFSYEGLDVGGGLALEAIPTATSLILKAITAPAALMAVPEPSSLTLLAGLLAGLALFSRRMGRKN